MVEAKEGDGGADLVEAFDADWRDEGVCRMVEGVEGGVGGKGGWGESGRVGGGKATDEVDL